ncbi:MAG: 2-amino-4-hydroxy-6-hydroxymethyldihydropteridine diphosphokinase [Campylobacterota bacterium]
MKKRLNASLVLYKTPTFPKTYGKSRRRFGAVIGIGGNTGDSKRIFSRLLLVLRKQPGVDVVKTSPLLKNPAFGYTDQPDFYNAVALLGTDLFPKAFLALMMRLEKRFKRKRLFTDGPRTLDLDIIFFDKFVSDTEELTLPHPRWAQRESVVIPLRYLHGIKNI